MPGHHTPNGPQSRSAERPQPWVSALGAGMDLAIWVLAGFGGGFWLDRAWGTDPGLTVAGAVAGMTIGLYKLIRRFPIRSRRP
ncbi:MAG: AtpZ/AtpI family protein [Elusimicrobiota bacterium]